MRHHTLGTAEAFLRTPLLGSELWQWLAGLGAAVLTLVILRVLVGFAGRRLGSMDEETRAGIRDLHYEVVHKTSWVFYVVVAVFLGSLFLSLGVRPRRVLMAAVTIAVLWQAGIWAAHTGRELLLWTLRRRADEKGETVFAGLVRALVTTIVWSVVLLLILDNLGVNVTTLLAGLSIGGLALALASQQIFADLFSALVIVLDKPFQVGDFIIVGDYMGTVDRLGIKTCRLRSLTGEQIVVSNSDLLGSRIRNYKRMKDRRISFTFGVVYGTPAEQLEAIPTWLKEIINAEKKARFDRAHFTGFGDSSLDFEVVYYVTVPDYATFRDIQQRMNLALYRRFEAEGVEFAYPTQTLHVATNVAPPASGPAHEGAGQPGQSGQPREPGRQTGRKPARKKSKKKPSRRRRPSS